jgi:hypothetical protein
MFAVIKKRNGIYTLGLEELVIGWCVNHMISIQISKTDTSLQHDANTG